jgi:uncharacterized protein (TIGR03435 family)
MEIRGLYRLGRSTLCAVVCLIGAVLSLHAQSTGAAAPIQFEVASLKPASDLMAPGIIRRMPGDRGYFGTNMPLLSYLTVAYQVRASQISGPDWISDHFDLDAKAERPSTVDELHVMLQHLLEERFHLKLRRESKEQAGYALVVDKGGPKLNIHPPEDRTLLPISPGWGKHTGTNVTMPYFAFYLSNELDRTVVDRTGLDGHYDFQVEWAGDRVNAAMPMPAAPAGSPGAPAPMEMREAQLPTGPTIFNALKQQLGLRLDPAKVPVEHLVVEHIEKLVEN